MNRISSNTISFFSVSGNNFNKTNVNSINPNSSAYKKADKSRVPPLRDRLVNDILKHNSSDTDSEKLLSELEKPNVGGPFLGGLPDLSNPDSMRRYNRIKNLFLKENEKFEVQKSDFIAAEKAAGKSAQDILKGIVSLYDSQSELFRVGMGWNGDVFAFDESSKAGYQRTIHFSSDVIDTIA